MSDDTFGVEILDIVDNDDGSCTLKLELPNGLTQAFMEEFGLEVFSEEKFNEFFVKAITEYLDAREQS